MLKYNTDSHLNYSFAKVRKNPMVRVDQVDIKNTPTYFRKLCQIRLNEFRQNIIS